MTAHPDVLGANAQGQIRSIIARIERLAEEQAELAEQLKEVFAEAKGNGFDVKILRKVVRIRKQDRAKRQEEEAITDLYLSAVGELPLFEERATPRRPDGDDIRATITSPGGFKVETTLGEMKALAADADLYDQAVTLVRETGNAATSHLQRRLQIGYNRAAQLMEQMERAGVVGPANHAGKREVLAHG